MKNRFFPFLIGAMITVSVPALAGECQLSSMVPEKKVVGLHLSSPADKRSWDWAADLGVRYARVALEWKKIETSEGTYDWAAADAVVKHARTRRIGVLAVLSGMPDWAIDHPDRPLKFAEFAQAAASRYKDITYWEIFTAPNRPGYGWPNLEVIAEHNAAAYADILRFANPAMRSVHPKAVIISGGLSPQGEDAMAFLRALYAKGVKNCFDVLGYQPYGDEGAFDLALSRIFDVTSDYADTKKPVWFTEYGTDQDDARVRILKDAFSQTGLVPALFWFTERDFSKWSGRYGLVDVDGRKKPEYLLFQDLVRAIHTP